LQGKLLTAKYAKTCYIHGGGALRRYAGITPLKGMRVAAIVQIN